MSKNEKASRPVSCGVRVPLLAAGPPQPEVRRPPAGLLGCRLRLAQLGLAVVALITMCCGESSNFARFLVPAAELQCAWSAVAAIVDVSKLRTRVSRWALWASLTLDMVTFLVTHCASSAALGIAHYVAVENCAAYPVRCAVTKSVWPEALLAWAALVLPSIYFVFMNLWVYALYYSLYRVAWFLMAFLQVDH